jgi:hypothetical protein
MMMLAYQRTMLKARVRTWLGSLLLVSVALWAGTTIWQAATGENIIVQAFSKAVERQTLQEDL